MGTYERRAAVNDESRNRAKHYREEWTRDEDNLLMECWGPEPMVDVAEVLGRTVEACKQRFYTVRRGEDESTQGKASSTTTTTVAYRGVLDDPEDQWWSPEYYTNER